MTNANDVIVFYEQNCERLEEEWCSALGVSTDMLDNEGWVEDNIFNNSEFWSYVETEMASYPNE